MIEVRVEVPEEKMERIATCLEQVGSVHQKMGSIEIFSNEPKKAVMRTALILQGLLEGNEWARIHAEFREDNVDYLYDIAVTHEGYFGFKVKLQHGLRTVTPIHGGAPLSELVNTCRAIEELVHYYIELKFVPWLRDGFWFQWVDQWAMQIMDEDENEVAVLQWDPRVIV